MLSFFLSPIAALLGDNVALMGLVAAALAGFGAVVVARHVSKKGNDVKRRLMGDAGAERGSERIEAPQGQGGGQSGFRRLIEAAAPALDEKSQKVLQAKLIQAGIFDRKALSLFFAARLGCGFGLGVIVCGFLLLRGASGWTTVTAFSMAGLIFGYMLPSLALDRRIARRQDEHRNGFPDVMDLMVVCSQAGLSMEAGIQRIAQELRLSYPSLALHLDLATLEIRGGKPMSGAIESLAKRLGIEEALSFATLLHQSEELGSSLTQSLRAYSDDMRNKRLMKAEEKAYALPAKLVVPLTLFIFPVLMMVLMLPVVVSVSRSGW